ncbi:hypothetical protein FPOA_13837 [Fusarium poae]|uniref:Uncharacterized protein n=1 Tax=Fusarium poae TaxID=36050 RepID=A0A1B8A4D0_FUSPO|nr:hypothetical protein FPOA_13837 [Fusarium poae]
MDPSKTRQAQAHARQRHMALAPSSAPGQLRMPASRTRGKHKSTAALVPQGVQPSSQRPYQQSFNGVPQKRKIPAHHHYDRQPQFIGTPEDVEDDDLLYPDEEGSFGQYSYDEEPMPQTIGAIMEILSDVQSQLTSLSHGFEEQRKGKRSPSLSAIDNRCEHVGNYLSDLVWQTSKADAVLKHLSRQSGENFRHWKNS